MTNVYFTLSLVSGNVIVDIYVTMENKNITKSLIAEIVLSTAVFYN